MMKISEFGEEEGRGGRGGGGGSESPATPSQPSRHNCMLNLNTTTDSLNSNYNNTCFRCKRPGHWSKNCTFNFKNPSFSTTTPPSSSSPNYNLNDLPSILCPHGHGTCSVKLCTKSPKNLGKMFYSCSISNGTTCKFFKWYDHVIDTDHSRFRVPPSSVHPLCPCGAGKCTLLVQPFCPNAGRYYFVCPIEKGHGACPFLQWYHESAQTTKTEMYGLNDQSVFNSESPKAMKLDSSPGMDKLEGPQTFLSLPYRTLDNSDVNVIPIQRNEDEEGLSSMASLDDPILFEEEFWNVMMKKELHVSCLNEESNRHISVIAAKDPMYQIGCIVGWLGRLAFPPSERLTVSPPKAFFGCVFPSYGPIRAPKNMDADPPELFISESHRPSTMGSDLPSQYLSQDSESFITSVLLETSSLCSIPGVSENDITRPVIDILNQAGLLVKNQLLKCLESMDPLNHGAMSMIAEFFFSILDRLSIDCNPFSRRVIKFISCVSSFAEIEQSMRSDLSLQEIKVKRSHDKRDQHKYLVHVQAQTMDTLTASDQCLQSLHEEASRLKEMLLQIDIQLMHCEAENLELKSQVGEISKKVMESEKDWQDAAKEAEGAVKMCQDRDITRLSAKAALEKAKAQLRC